jgi:glucose-1-phosphate cytidylyltransferase
MKTIILAGGLGSRLGSITETIPKPMVKIGDKPIIWHIMNIYAHYGYNDFILSLGYKAEVIKEYFYNYSIHQSDFSINLKSNVVKQLNKKNAQDWNITLVDTGLNTLKGARIKRVEQYLDDVNLLTYGDGVADLDINKLVAFHKSHGKTITITGVRPPSRFGEISVVDGRLMSFQEKPQTSAGLINGGYMVFNKNLLEYLTVDENCDLEYGAFNTLADKGEMMVFTSENQWECVDTERDLRHLNALWDSNKAFWKVWK